MLELPSIALVERPLNSDTNMVMRCLVMFSPSDWPISTKFTRNGSDFPSPFSLLHVN